ncbi:MAG: transcription termination/antitermination protein NusA [bacterium]|nr:transcription termination/antitermination protein NusA [bacterium]
MLDLKALQSALEQLEEEKGVPREKIIEAIEMALAAAYKKDFGKKGQIIRAKFNMETGETEFSQVKIAVDESMLKPEEDLEAEPPSGDSVSKPEESEEGEERKVRFNPEHHIMIEEARKIKKDIQPGEEIVFPLEGKKDYGRIAAQTAKQVIIQKIREAERASIFGEFKEKQGEIISGIVQRIDNSNVFVDLGRVTAILPRDEQIRGERYRIGERVRALLLSIEEAPRGVNLYLSRSHPKFIEKLFELEVPEIASGAVEIKSIAREAGGRTKIAVVSHEDGVDPVGSCVGQKGTRINTVIAELGGEKIDIIEWSEDISEFIANSLSPAKVLDVEIKEEERAAAVTVDEDQLSLAIGKSGQNVRLAAKLTGWKIDIRSAEGESVAAATEDGEVEMEEVEIK